MNESQKKIDAAYLNTPAEYHGFITIIKGNPYMRVDGRVAMARDEHRELGKRLDILKPVFDMVFDIPTCQVTVFSEIFGTATGTAKVSIGGRGVDQTNPLENAETSAVGRALGFMGYGLLGGGIASAEEVEQAIQEQGPAPKSTKVAEADPYDLPARGEERNSPAESATDAQMKFLRGLLSKNGTLKGDSLPVIHAVYEGGIISKANVSADIEALGTSDKLTPKYLAAYLKLLRETAKLSQKDVYEYIMKYFNTVKVKDLTREQQDQLIGWLTIGNAPDSDWEKGLAFASRVTDGDMDLAESWMRHAFVEFSDDEIGQRVLRMNIQDMAKSVAGYLKDMAEATK